jgi:hypothetical protein
MASIKKVSFSQSHSSIEDIEEYYVDSEESLNYYFNPLNFGVIPDRFIGYTKIEFDDELKTRKETLDRMCALEVLAAIEARLRIDYLVRCQNKKRDGFSQKLRQIHQVKANNASLKDDIVAAWKENFPEHKTRLDNLGKALDFRNWLAHGRYWQATKSPHIYKYDYLAIFTLASDILSNMDLKESA